MQQEQQAGEVNGPAHRKLRKLSQGLRKAQNNASRLHRKSSGTTMVDFDDVHVQGVLQYSFIDSPPRTRSKPSTPTKRGVRGESTASNAPIPFTPPRPAPISVLTNHLPLIPISTTPTSILPSDDIVDNRGTQTSTLSRKRKDVVHSESESTKRQKVDNPTSGLKMHFYNPKGSAHNYWRRG